MIFFVHIVGTVLLTDRFIFRRSDAKAEKIQMSSPIKEAKADKTYSLSMGKANKGESMRY